MTLLRRKFLHLFAGVAAMPLSRFAQAQVSPTTSQSVRVATGLLATWQSTAWLGAEAGVFKKRGIDMTLPAIAVGGPEAAAGTHSRRLGVCSHRNRARCGRSPQRPRRRDFGNANVGFP